MRVTSSTGDVDPSGGSVIAPPAPTDGCAPVESLYHRSFRDLGGDRGAAMGASARFPADERLTICRPVPPACARLPCQGQGREQEMATRRHQAEGEQRILVRFADDEIAEGCTSD